MSTSPFRWIGYTGQPHEPGTGWQFLGSGYRVYNPALMRFHSPDSLSPFADGGINAYAYCDGDPVNNVDPTGHFPVAIGAILGVGALVTSALAVATGVSGDKKAAAILGTIGAVLATAAIAAAGIHATRPKPLGTWDFRVRKGRVAHVVDIHGYEGLRMDGPWTRTGKRLDTLLESKGIGRDHRPTVLLTCNSADGIDPLAQQVARRFGIPVKGYFGAVTTSRRLHVPRLDHPAKWFYPGTPLNSEVGVIRKSMLTSRAGEPARRHSVRSRRPS